MSTEKERRLGLENAKLALKIHRQRLALSTRTETLHSMYVVSERAEAVHRQNINLREQNTKLATENRALRMYVAEGKVRPEGLGEYILKLLKGER